MVADQKDIMDERGLEESDLGGFLMNSPDCTMLDHTISEQHSEIHEIWGLESKFQQRKLSRRTNGGFMNGIYSS